MHILCLALSLGFSTAYGAEDRLSEVLKQLDAVNKRLEALEKRLSEQESAISRQAEWIQFNRQDTQENIDSIERNRLELNNMFDGIADLKRHLISIQEDINHFHQRANPSLPSINKQEPFQLLVKIRDQNKIVEDARLEAVPLEASLYTKHSIYKGVYVVLFFLANTSGLKTNHYLNAANPWRFNIYLPKAKTLGKVMNKKLNLTPGKYDAKEASLNVELHSPMFVNSDIKFAELMLIPRGQGGLQLSLDVFYKTKTDKIMNLQLEGPILTVFINEPGFGYQVPKDQPLEKLQ